MQADISLNIHLSNKLFADPRRIRLLQAIQQTGSISQGARQAGISYKTAWDAIHEMNTLAENPVVASNTGGKGGGGASLTAYGERLIQLYQLLEQIQQKAFDNLQKDTLPLNSLLAAIAVPHCKPVPVTSCSVLSVRYSTPVRLTSSLSC